MKKIFLPLLALVGMVAGFTLCSCGGGGGGDNDGPARAIANCSVQILSTPVVSVYFNEAVTGWTLDAQVVAGADSPMPALFTITRQPTKENGAWRFWGEVNFRSVQKFSTSAELLSFFGAPQEANSLTLSSFQFYMDIKENHSGNIAGSGATSVEGRYFGTDTDTSDGKPLQVTPIPRNFIFTGRLKTQYLEESATPGTDSDDF